MVCSQKADKDGSFNVSCSNCEGVFHARCQNLKNSEAQTILSLNLGWTCSFCQVKGGNDEKEIPERVAKDASSAAAKSSVPEDSIERFRKTFEQELQKLCANLLVTNKKIDDATVGVTETKSVVQELVKSIETLRGENENLKTRVSDLEARLHNSERLEELNALEIHGVPEVLEGDIHEKAGEILSSALGTEISINDISDSFVIKRSSKKRVTRASTTESNGDILVVRFTTRRQRENIMRVARQKGKSTRGVLGTSTLAGEKFNVRIRERITFYTRGLLKEARDVAEKRGWKFVWIKHGRVLVRKKEKDRVYIVNSVVDLNNIH